VHRGNWQEKQKKGKKGEKGSPPLQKVGDFIKSRKAGRKEKVKKRVGQEKPRWS